MLTRTMSAPGSGVAMDDLVYICTKIARQMDAQGLDRVFDAAEAATAAIEEARPLLARVVELVDEVRCWWLLPGPLGFSMRYRGRAPCNGALGRPSRNYPRPMRACHQLVQRVRAARAKW